MSAVLPFVGPALSLMGAFGGGGSQKTPQTQVLSAGDQLSSLPPYLQDLYKSSANFLLGNLGQRFGYPGQLQVGMSPLSQQAYSDIGSLTGITPFAGGEMTADITGQYLDPTRNPVVQNMVAMLNNRYGPDSMNTQENLRTLHGHFNPASAASGAQGYSGAASAEGSLLGNLQAQLASQVAQLLGNVYGQERGIQTGETNQALNIPGQMSAIGAVPTTLAQQNIQAQQGDWLNQIKSMMGIPQAMFPSLAGAFSPQQQSVAYGTNPLAAAGAGMTSFVNSPAFNALFPPSSGGGGASAPGVSNNYAPNLASGGPGNIYPDAAPQFWSGGANY